MSKLTVEERNRIISKARKQLTAAEKYIVELEQELALARLKNGEAMNELTWLYINDEAVRRAVNFSVLFIDSDDVCPLLMDEHRFKCECDDYCPIG